MSSILSSSLQCNVFSVVTPGGKVGDIARSARLAAEDSINYEFIIVHVGTNNLHNYNVEQCTFPHTLVDLQQKMSHLVSFLFPHSTIILNSILPRVGVPWHNNSIPYIASKWQRAITGMPSNIVFNNLTRTFLRRNQAVLSQFYLADGLHLNRAGKRELAKHISTTVARYGSDTDLRHCL